MLFVEANKLFRVFSRSVQAPIPSLNKGWAALAYAELLEEGKDSLPYVTEYDLRK